MTYLVEQTKQLLDRMSSTYSPELIQAYLLEEYGFGSYDDLKPYSEQEMEQFIMEFDGDLNQILFEDDGQVARYLQQWQPEEEEDDAGQATPVFQSPPAPPVRTVTYPNPINDEFEVLFDNFDDLVLCNQELEQTETVSSHDEDMVSAGGIDTKHITVKAVIDAPVAAAGEASRMGCDVDALLDTMRSSGGTGLSLQMGNSTIPVGASAMSGLRDRAGFTEDGLMRHWRKSDEDAASALNRQFANWNSSATVIERAGKIRSFMSKNFAYGKYSDILSVFEEFWKQKYPNATVDSCYLNHEIMRWEMDLEAYKNQIFNGFPSLLISGYKPMLIFRVSNTGDSAFRITPALGQSGSGIVVPIAQFNGAIAIKHIASGNFAERCDKLMNQIMHSYAGIDSMLSAATGNLDSLQHTTVNNAYNALLRTMDDCGFPKQQGMEAADNFKNIYGSGQATAFDCFVACMNAYGFVCRDYPANTNKQFATSLSVGKAANAPWQMRGDIPGDYSWK